MVRGIWHARQEAKRRLQWFVDASGGNRGHRREVEGAKTGARRAGETG
jgi:hypothetical protein